jgi:hypothetical protein
MDKAAMRAGPATIRDCQSFQLLRIPSAGDSEAEK